MKSFQPYLVISPCCASFVRDNMCTSTKPVVHVVVVAVVIVVVVVAARVHSLTLNVPKLAAKQTNIKSDSPVCSASTRSHISPVMVPGGGCVATAVVAAPFIMESVGQKVRPATPPPTLPANDH